MAMSPSADRPAPVQRPSIVRRAVVPNIAVLTLTLLLLLVTPVTLHAPPRPAEAVILAAGLTLMAVLNLLLVRRAFTPLRSFAAQMEAVDLRDLDQSRLVGEIPSKELAIFVNSFNAMLDRLAEERRAGGRAALLAQERERLRIARALHDEAGQTLTAVALDIERAASQASEPERERMLGLAAELHSTLDEIRRIARELRPEALDDLGLINALIALSSRVARQGGLQIERQFSELPEISKELELVIYRVAQEALTNVLRHAQASHCVLALRSLGHEIELEVSDNGRGMPEQLDGTTIGLEGMRERASLARGSLVISSDLEGGTRVSLKVPVGES
jgi:two-component system, NarL family, sensor histidine kinase UhpB